MSGSRRIFGSLIVVALVGAGLWVVSSPAEAVQDTIVIASDGLVSTAVLEQSAVAATDGSEDFVFVKPIKDPACRKPCKPFVRTKTGLICGFVGCFEETGDCAYRC